MPLNMSSFFKYRDLQETGLLGEFPLSSFRFPNFQTLRLSSNLNLYFELTQFNWSSVGSSLLELDLSYTSTAGNLPYSLGNGKSLKYLRLLLQGPVSPSISKLVNLGVTDLSSNKLSGNVGIEMFSSMKRLGNRSEKHDKMIIPYFRELFLSSSRVNEFPVFLRKLDKLYALDLSNNNISGQIPYWLKDLSQNPLRYLYLSDNFLTAVLDLKSNLLQGPLPLSICNLSSLSILDFSGNKFNGGIPECLLMLKGLTVLDLGSNNFQGSIRKKSSAEQVPPPSMPEQEAGSEDFARAFTWRDVLMGFGCRLVFGFTMGLFMLRIAKPKWLINISESCYQKLKRH
ncbi:unnamed protein product [Withania somnifera]